MEEDKYWLWLLRIPGLGLGKTNQLLKKYQNPEVIWRLSQKELLSIYGIGEEVANNILRREYRENLEKELEEMQKKQIQFITRRDKNYPKLLSHIYDPPLALFVKGNVEVLNKSMLAMVGCREPSNYGKQVAIHFSRELAKRGIGVISGMAKGIDTYSHLGCLEEKGNTIAVLGCGVDVIYPKENIKLYQRILQEGGAVISEYGVGTNPHKMRFPARNRIISGISCGVIVVEAKEKSGTLITTDFALEQGRQVFAVPRKY